MQVSRRLLFGARTNTEGPKGRRFPQPGYGMGPGTPDLFLFPRNPRHFSQVKNNLGDGALSSANGEHFQSRMSSDRCACCLDRV
jgi:hypothetical protein